MKYVTLLYIDRVDFLAVYTDLTWPSQRQKQKSYPNIVLI